MKIVGLDLQEHNSARALSFFVHFFAVVVRLRQETSYYHVYEWREHEKKIRFFFFRT